jgi:hypothetical protein
MMRGDVEEGRPAQVRSVSDPDAPIPWYRLDPWDHVRPYGFDDEDEPYYGELPPVLPGEGSSGGKAPSPFGVIDPGTGVCSKRSLVVQLNWTVSQTDHPQKMIRVGDAEIGVDASLAPLIRSLNAIGCQTMTSCEGTGDTVRAYVMFTENGGRTFAKFWHRRLAPLGYQQPVLYHELRDADWRMEIGSKRLANRVVAALHAER